MKPLIVTLGEYNPLKLFNPFKQRFTTIRFIVASFITIILIGAILLMLPISSASRASQPFINALFTSTSAVSTTGLTVVDTGSYYSFFGQLVIITLIQIGGLGYMVFIIAAAYALKRRISLNSKVIAQESVVGTTLGNMKTLIKHTVAYTIIFEFICALVLTFYWRGKFPLGKALWLGIFHSISAFSTAGFSLFADSFVSYQSSIIVFAIICVTSIAGGIGFFALYDMESLALKKIKGIHPQELSVHTKLVLVVSIALMALGTGVILISETYSAPLSFIQKVLNASFQAISASTTTGFNSIEVGALSATSLFMLVILMFIGSSPGGTGGGIKTTTLGVILHFLVSMFKGRQDVNISRRRCPYSIVNKSFAILVMALGFLISGSLLLTVTENTAFLKIVFEVASALGTVGLSTGITPGLSFVGKTVIIIIMLIGRVGPLAVGFTLFGKQKEATFRYAEGNVFVG